MERNVRNRYALPWGEDIRWRRNSWQCMGERGQTRREKRERRGWDGYIPMIARDQ
jgi:hypothetical protein